jgi:hypothetical protein
MYNPLQIKAGFLDVVGWRQNPDPNGEQLLELTTTTSGIYFNDIHPHLTIDNLVSLAPDFSLITRASYNGATAYNVGDVVTDGGSLFYCIQAGTGNATNDTDYWTETTEFTLWLKEETQAGILKAVRSWYQAKVKQMTSRNLVERKRIFSQAGDLTDEETVPAGTMAGLEIAVCRHLGLKAVIHQVGLQFSTSGSVTLYLFKSDQVAPVQTSTAITYVTAGAVQWEALDWELDPDGTYFLAFDSDAIPGNPITGIYDYALGQGGAEPYRERYNTFPAGRFFKVAGFSATGDPGTFWDIKTTRRTFSTNYGLNLQLSVKCDYTELLLEQKAIFQDVIALQVASRLLRQLALNPSVATNRHERNLDTTQLLYEIDGDSQGRPGGLKKELELAVQAVDFDTEGIDKICLPCRRKGARYKSATR